MAPATGCTEDSAGISKEGGATIRLTRAALDDALNDQFRNGRNSYRIDLAQIAPSGRPLCLMEIAHLSVQGDVPELELRLRNRESSIAIDAGLLLTAREGDWWGTAGDGSIFSARWRDGQLQLQNYLPNKPESARSITLPEADFNYLAERLSPFIPANDGYLVKIGQGESRHNDQAQPIPPRRDYVSTAYPLTAERFVSMDLPVHTDIHGSTALINTQVWRERRLQQSVCVDLDTYRQALKGDFHAPIEYLDGRFCGARWRGDTVEIYDYHQLDHDCWENCADDCQVEFDEADKRQAELSRSELAWICNQFAEVAG